MTIEPMTSVLPKPGLVDTIPNRIVLAAAVILACISLPFLQSGLLAAPSAGEGPVAIVVSRHIKPYMQAETGLREVLDEQGSFEISTLVLEKGLGPELKDLDDQLRTGGYRVVVSIGPEATDFVWSIDDLPSVRVFTMVLSPKQVLGRPLAAVTGVSLTIPIDIQIGSIRESIPSLDSLGLLFNPLNNQDFFQKARAASLGAGIEIVPLKITSQEDVPQVLETSWGSIDGVWLIPDRTVISRSLVEYIIKEALYQRVPVIGYNRFFYQAGAALAFVFDYRDIGRQTGRMVLGKLSGRDVPVQGAVFEIWKKETVLERIGLQPARSER